MKLYYKIFLIAYLIVIATVGIGGFFLTNGAISTILDTQTQRVIASNESAAKMFVLLLQEEQNPRGRINSITQRLAMLSNSENIRLTIYSPDSEPMPRELDSESLSRDLLFQSLEPGQQGSRYLGQGSNLFEAAVRVQYEQEDYLILSVSDFTEAFSQRDRILGQYRLILFVSALLSAAALFFFAMRVARPIQKISRVSGNIAKGQYDRRVELSERSAGSAEIAELAENFNRMADQVEENIHSLERENERQQEFVSNFTHELKTPMTSIIGYADLLRSYDLSEEEIRKFSDSIHREGKRLEKLSMTLLELLVMQHEPPELAPLSIRQFSQEFGGTAAFITQKYGVKIRFELKNAIVLAEGTLLHSLLNNLTENAAKASEKDATIEISGKPEGDLYEICVADHGRGISPEALAKITEPFYMEDKSRSRSQGGAGLGLALCAKIAAIHKTQLRFESELSKGTKVSFALMLQKGRREKNETG